jgi:predicted methyltransferase
MTRSVFRRLLLSLAGLLLVSTGAGCSSGKLDLGRLVSSGRDGYQQPERVVSALEIRPGQRVAEIGAGSGYWLPFLSDAVGPAGTVYAVEVEAPLVEELQRLKDERGLTNVRVILGRYEDPLLPDGSIDIAITSKTYHHIEGRVDYFKRLRADLAPDGRVVHLDDRDDLGAPLAWLLTQGHTSNTAEMDDEMTRAGYRKAQSFDFLLTQSFQVYEPRGQTRSATTRQEN